MLSVGCACVRVTPKFYFDQLPHNNSYGALIKAARFNPSAPSRLKLIFFPVWRYFSFKSDFIYLSLKITPLLRALCVTI